MATKENETSDSDIYEDTEVMPPAGITAPGNNEVNTIYEPLRMEDGKLSQVNTVARRKGKCGKSGWWTAGAVVTIVLCIGISYVTVRLSATECATETRCSNNEIENRLTELESVQHMNTAAFSVYPSASSLTLNNADVVPFDTVITDSMNGFDTDEHHYTCPISGTYYFSLCINLGPLGGENEDTSEIDLLVDGSIIIEVYSDNDDNDDAHYDQGCNAVICKCSAGSHVLGKCSSGCRLLGSWGEPQSILSGFLIYPE